MNKTAVAILAVYAFTAALLAGVAVAGINPANFGLPSVQLATGDNNFYNLAVAVPGGQASVMCVACHSRNPGRHDAYRVTNGFGYMGSHFVTLSFAANETSKGGGYSDGSGAKARATRGAAGAATIYMADNTTGLLIPANGWYGLPKYGVLTATIPDNTTLPRAATSPQLICESCHNIVKNIGPAKLLAYGMANGTATSGTTGPAKGTQVPVLCIGCHGDMDSSLNAEWQLHPLQTGETWVGTQHHRNTDGATPPVYAGAGTDIAPATHDMGVVNAGYYGATLIQSGQQIGGGSNQMWAPGRGQLGTSAEPDHALSWTATGLTRMKGLADNNQIQPNAATQLLCTNCHRAHNADSSAGATILMRGSDVATAMGTGTVANSVATAYLGVRRMEDKGGRNAAFNSTNPLCLACHL